VAAPAQEAVEAPVEEPENTVGVPVGDAPDAAAEPPEALDDTDTDDLDALYASVTPGAHRDMVSGGRAAAPAHPAPTAAAVATAPASGRAQRHHNGRPAIPAAPIAAPAGTGPWKIVAIAASALLAVVVLFGFVVPFVFSLGTGATAGPRWTWPRSPR
jgi:hypothetical protein